MAKAKPTCNHECLATFTCPYDDCIVDDITTTERLEQDQRDRNYSTHGVHWQARRQRKKKGQRV